MTKIKLENIALEILEHLDCSFYNHNYYRIKTNYSDYYDLLNNDIVYVVSEDDNPLEDIYIGKFNADGVFVAEIMFTVENPNF